MVQKIGHRGAKGYVAENTLESFQKALDLGVDAIEFDVHACASGELVVFHDFTVDRMTNGSGEIHKMTLSELKKLKVAAAFKIPTLRETLDLIDRKCWINIELKGHDTAGPTCQLLDEYTNEKGWSYDDFIVSSFQKDELKRVKAINSKIRLATLSQVSVEQALAWAEELSAYAIHPHFSLLTQDNIADAKAKGYRINVWTVNHKEDIQHLEGYTIDGIISDFPDRL